MVAKKGSKESIVSKILKAPFRILMMAKDFYMKSMPEYSDQLGSYGSAIGGCSSSQVNTIHRSFSVTISTKSSKPDDDYRELLRAASTKTSNNKVGNLNHLQRQTSTTTGSANMPRSQSVGIGRIDEDQPCEFGIDLKVKNDVIPRSRSYALSNRRIARAL